MSEAGFGVKQLNIEGPGNPLITTALDLQILAPNVSIGSTVTIQTVSDIYTNSSTVGTALTCNYGDGPITRTTSTNIEKINIDKVPTTNNRVFNHTVLLVPDANVSNLSNIVFEVNGSSLTSGGNSIRWLGSIQPSGTAVGYYLFGFSILRVNPNWEVLAVFANYG